MLSALDFIKLIPGLATVILIIQIPLLFLLRKYTKIDNYLKPLYLLILILIVIVFEILKYQSIDSGLFKTLFFGWFIPSIGVSLIVGVLYKIFKKSFAENFYFAFLLMTVPAQILQFF